MKEIQDESDLSNLISGSEVVALLCYRGDWCPFCRKQLKQLARIMPDFSLKNADFFAVTSDPIEKNLTLKEKLNLPFNIISDPNIQLHKAYQSPISTAHFKAKSYPSNAFLQPAFFLFNKGELVYEWKQESTMTNMGGAIFRISSKDIVGKINEYVS